MELITMMKKIFCFLSLYLLITHASFVLATVVKEPPTTLDPNGRYMFLMFGLQTEFQGPDSYNQMYQKRYETTAIAKAFSDRGYTVITEIRQRNTAEEDYARKLSVQVKQLLDSGVKPENIVIAGHSKGAVMTLISSGMLAVPKVKFVVMAGCALPSTTRIANVNPRQMYVEFIDKYATKAQGKMLSIYDVEDTEFQSCHEYSKAASSLKMTEKIVNTNSSKGKGHAAFYSPDPNWMDIVLDWLNE